MADGSPLHRAFHSAWTAACAYIEAAQPHVVPDTFRVVVLSARNGVPAPAHDEIGPEIRVQDPCMFQDVKDGIRDVVAPTEIESIASLDLGADVDEVPQHGEQMLANSLDDPAVDKRAGRRILDLEL